MPKRPLHTCNHPGCPELTNERFCEKHTKQQQQVYDRYDRDKEAKAFYNSPEWLRQRAYKLSRDPLCEECKRNGELTPAYMVDHRKPISDGGERYDLDNLQSLCLGCHSRKTVKEQEGFKRKFKQEA